MTRALRDTGLVWLMLLAQPALAREVGSAEATSLCFAGALAWLVATRQPRSVGQESVSGFFAGGVAAGYLAFPVVCLASGLVAGLVGVDAGPPLAPWSAPPAMLPSLLVLGPAFEELLYRERLLGALEGRVPRGIAVLATSAAFALPHLEPRVVVASFVTGLGLAAVWLRTRSIALCIGVHVGLNLAVQRGGVPPW